MVRVPAFQAGYAGSIPVTRSIETCCQSIPRGFRTTRTGYRSARFAPLLGRPPGSSSPTRSNAGLPSCWRQDPPPSAGTRRRAGHDADAERRPRPPERVPIGVGLLREHLGSQHLDTARRGPSSGPDPQRRPRRFLVDRRRQRCHERLFDDRAVNWNVARSVSPVPRRTSPFPLMWRGLESAHATGTTAGSGRRLADRSMQQ
jgi:hypothetical protein